jgi:hypothetical protein
VDFDCCADGASSNSPKRSLISIRFDSIRYQDQMCTMVSVINMSDSQGLQDAKKELAINKKARKIVETDLKVHTTKIEKWAS